MCRISTIHSSNLFRGEEKRGQEDDYYHWRNWERVSGISSPGPHFLAKAIIIGSGRGRAARAGGKMRNLSDRKTKKDYEGEKYIFLI